ncbi:MAG: LamG domain-containing protein, partial [Gimesia sp.]
MKILAYIKSPLSILAISLALPLFPSISFAEKPTKANKPSATYRELILSDKPAVYWNFEQRSKAGYSSLSTSQQKPGVKFEPVMALESGTLAEATAGPRPSEFPLFHPKNRAAEFKAGTGFLRVVDPGEKSVLDFTVGDSITLEAWINLNSTQAGKYRYIIGKGRTNRKGVARDNQNYSLRVTGSEISFLFCGKPEKKEVKPDYHRWTSTGAGLATHHWHHVAVTYTFGKKKSFKAYVDGRTVSGKWDVGGDTTNPPVVDNDEVWIGSSMGGSANSSFDGRMDEVAIYRTALSAKRIATHFKYVTPKLRIDWAAVPSDRVQVEILEGIPNQKSWNFPHPRIAETFTQPHFSLVEIPNRYSARGIKVDRPDPFLVRAMSRITIPKGKKRILVRARNASRLYIDEKLVLETGFHNISSSAHGFVFDIDLSLAPNIRPLHRGDQEKVIQYTGDGKSHRVRFEMIVGGFRHRPDFGETAVFIGDSEKDFQLLTTTNDVVMLTDESWVPFESKYRYDLIAVNAQ